MTAAGEPGGFIEAEGGGFTQAMGDGIRVGYEPSAGEVGELRSLLGLRDSARAVVEADRTTAAAGSSGADVRAELGSRYEAYVAAYGPVNRTDGPGVVGVPSQGGFRADPYAPLVYALERVDPATGDIAKSEVFTARVATPDLSLE